MLNQIRKNLKSQKGFTLVELMIVILIIGVLAAIALPKYTEATSTATGAKIVADLRTIDSAIVMAQAAGTTVTKGMDLTKLGTLQSDPKAPQDKAFKVTGGKSGTVSAAGVYSIDANLRAQLDDHDVTWYITP